MIEHDEEELKDPVTEQTAYTSKMLLIFCAWKYCYILVLINSTATTVISAFFKIILSQCQLKY